MDLNEKGFKKYFLLHSNDMKDLFIAYKEIGSLSWRRDVTLKTIKLKLKETNLKADKYIKNLKESFLN